MADWYIYRANGKLDNVIVAEEDFVKKFCASMGYTYKLRPSIQSTEEPIVEEPPDDPKTLTQKVKAVDQRQEFLEDCIAEMAMQVYSE